MKHSDSSWENYDKNGKMTWLMTSLNEEWDTTSGCVIHGESDAELGWVVPEMSIKPSKGWYLRQWAMMLPNQSWCSISFRTDEWVQKDVPTRVISNCLLGQAVITHLEGWGLSPDLNWLGLWTRLLCGPPGRWSVEDTEWSHTYAPTTLSI